MDWAGEAIRALLGIGGALAVYGWAAWRFRRPGSEPVDVQDNGLD